MSFANIAAIVRADFLIRFRRLSTLVVFLLLSALAYVWVPDPASGRTLMQIHTQRAIYNSAAIGVGTAGLATIFIGMVGFYVISNALKHDVRSRAGFIIASTRWAAPSTSSASSRAPANNASPGPANDATTSASAPIPTT